MLFKKLNSLAKLYLKNTNEEAYQKVNDLSSINFLDISKAFIDFKDNIHFEDFIYILPAMNTLVENRNVNIHWNIGQKVKVGCLLSGFIVCYDLS
ncbi:hypothetical protein [Arcicella rosea]|uniref:Uncharacterized protein n=1 Tax=Arcicella rosea TaxID=502909 RepID=A0A841ER54_9BACT|nr:hypothetical protein [Arcicella rosea]MBB6005755.1 hypothetical protein [Arcicella rosea]